MKKTLIFNDQIKIFNKVHNNKYTYVESSYINNSSKMAIICPIHGEFYQEPYSHKRGCGCPKCKSENMRKLKTKPKNQLEKEFNRIHNNFYTYDWSTYTNSFIKMRIICPIHGEFYQIPNDHKKHCGCRECYKLNQSKLLITPFDELVEIFNAIHNYKYDYTKCQYKNQQTKIEIICPDHGSFFQSPIMHKSGQGCPNCDLERKKQVTPFNKALNILNDVHNNKYTYDEFTYTNMSSKIRIICPIHGEFWQNIQNHKNGQGCSLCGQQKHLIQSQNRSSFPFDKILKQFRKIHGDKYQYDESTYIKVSEKIRIICPTHGEFYQRVICHKRGDGCPLCAKEENILSIEKTKSQFEKIHQNDYSYCWETYKNSSLKMKIICKKCNTVFFQSPSMHKSGQGCPNCKTSKGELEIRNFLTINKIKFKQHKRFKDCKFKSTLPFDFYLPNHNICIEYDGIQHFEFLDFFHKTMQNFKEQQIRDNIKSEYCKNNDIKLIRISYKDKNNIYNILNNILLVDINKLF